MDSTIYSEVLVVIDILLGNILRNHVVRHIAGAAAKGFRAHICRPQNCFLICGNSAIMWCAVFPFSHCSNRLIVTCGGIDTNKCTWSFATCPFMIFTSCCAQNF